MTLNVYKMICKMLSNEQKVQECDTRDDDSRTTGCYKQKTVSFGDNVTRISH